MKRHCLALDLKDDPQLIKEYEEYHQKVWPEVLKSLTDSGIVDMEIYRVGNRMFMIMETVDDFTFEKKAEMDAANPHVAKWEELMWGFQQPIPWAKAGEKWVLMDRIFKSGL